MTLKYVPSISQGDEIIVENYSGVLVNITVSIPKIEILRSVTNCSFIFGDSGGYQKYNLNRRYMLGKGKRQCLVIPGFGIRNIDNFLIIDPKDLCRKYGELNIDCGCTLDDPMVGSSDEEFNRKLKQSYRWAELMFECRDDLCRETKLITPLQYFTKAQLYRYHKKMAKLNPNGYAIPVRGTTNLIQFIRVALSLAYLYANGVKIIHLLGSSRPEIIVLAAVAKKLDMFSQITFDSTTWRTSMHSGKLKYFDSDTLKLKSIKKSKKITLILPSSLSTKLRSGDEKVRLRKLVQLHNVLVIAKYTRRMEQLGEDIVGLKRHVKGAGYLDSQRCRLLAAIDILKLSKTHGYGFVDELYDWVWH